MALGFFKKKNTANVIYMNGHIYTQDPEFPWASAVACRDGRILAVGDFEAMDEISSDDTQIINLKEQYMFPGFIEAHGTQILKTFSQQYLSLDPIWDLDTTLGAVSDYCESSDAEVIFGYGYSEAILTDYDEAEEVHSLLDEIEADRPVILLGISGIHCWLNTLADDIIRAAAEDQCLQYVSTEFILHTLAPLDFEAVEGCVMETADEMADKGITAVFPLNTPDYFNSVFQSCLIALIGENITLKQRLFSSVYINRPLPPALVLHKLSEARTNCTELDGMITSDFLKIEVSEDENLAFFTQEQLNTICLAAAEKGYHIHIDALDKESAQKAAETFRFLRSKGCRNNTFVLAADRDSGLSEEEEFITTWQTDYLNESVFGHAQNVSEAIDLLTLSAAEMLGISKESGSIEKGKRADFTVFEENPLDKTLRYFSTMHASRTIVDSLIVYDQDEARDEEMCGLLFSMQL